MGVTNAYHRPLVSGIRIKSARREGNGLQPIGGGTLTGLATRNSDGKKLLVANLHIMAGLGDNYQFQEPSGGEEMYQESVTANKKVGTLPAWDPDNPAWVPIVDGQDNVADVAICELDDNVTAEFTLHDHPTHTDRKIIEGVVEPTEDMTLTMLGATGGKGTVTIYEVGDEEEFGGTIFTGLTVLDCSQRPVRSGDSPKSPSR